MTEHDSPSQEPTPQPPQSDQGQAGPPPPPPSSQESPAKADLGKRAVAMIIDAVIATVIGFIPAIGGLIGAAYMLLRDGLEFDFMNQRSVGKHVMKLHIESLDGSPLDIVTSIRRNWMFALGALIPLLLFIPVIGWIAIPFVGLAGLALGIVEVVLVITDPGGRRLGDKIANTRVIED